MNKSFAVITGASSGIGKEFAKILAKEGFNLILVARNKQRLEKLKNDLLKLYKIKIEIIKKDLSKQKSAIEIFEKLKNKNIDILINNAGFGIYGKFYKTDMNKEINMINLNILTLTILTKLILKKMLKNKKGKILNVASTAAFQPIPSFAVYSSSKAYVLNFTLALAEEVNNKNITISCLAPGPTATGFFRAAHLENNNIANSKLMSAAKCAMIGYKGLLKGKKLIIPGFFNKILALGAKATPYFLVYIITKYIMRKKRGQK